MEGKGEEEAEKRQDLVRKLVKDVVHCDITQEQPIVPGYDQHYDVVISSLVLQSVAKSPDEYVTYTSRLKNLVKPGGTLILYGIENKNGYYVVGDNKFQDLHVTTKFMITTLVEARFTDIIVDRFIPCVPDKIFSFIKCRRRV